MKILLPGKFLDERTYIVNVLLKDFLGLQFEIEVHNILDYVILLPNGKELWIKDHFFSHVPPTEGYLHHSFLPTKVSFAKNRFIPEQDIPIIYGTEDVDVIRDERIICNIDLFASSFFMLTRWEEYVNKNRDSFDRFPAKESLANKHLFLDRPVVNEYTEMLWSMLLFLGIEQDRLERRFSIIPTHDVDHIRLWDSPIDVLRTMVGDLTIRRNVNLALSRPKQYLNIKNNHEKDPFDTFDDIMDQSEALGIQSRFFFMNGGVTKFDRKYKLKDRHVQNVIQRIKRRNHIIGFHPSFNTYTNPELWKQEKEGLEEVLGLPVKEGRQHYLRFQVPLTWEIWEKNNMTVDMTMGYAEKEGFRAGTCYEYRVFDILKRRTLDVTEFPLIVMESTFFYQDDVRPEEMIKRINYLKQKVKKYNGNFVILWHNSNFNHGIWKDIKHVYKEVLRRDDDEQ
ncbi:polysaccharide deacetylase family protein [Bacillus pinisoli]|uniref:polysaccharide deacetylase family protein n=1 Tax=Bacillus pinisoli TaxID=2901866 RepID=UPI001FF43A88|nr:polysaccharide deacetylase family protein [Bacillus pinisoli]